MHALSLASSCEELYAWERHLREDQVSADNFTHKDTVHLRRPEVPLFLEDPFGGPPALSSSSSSVGISTNDGEAVACADEGAGSLYVSARDSAFCFPLSRWRADDSAALALLLSSRVSVFFGVLGGGALARSIAWRNLSNSTVESFSFRPRVIMVSRAECSVNCFFWTWASSHPS